MKKKCRKCGEEKPATPEYFHRHKTGKYGVRQNCKECVNKHNSKPEIREQRQEYWKHYSKNNAELIRQSNKKYREINQEEINKKQRKKYRDNRKKIIKRGVEYKRQRRKTNLTFRLQHRMRNGIGKCLSGARKSSSTFDYIGTTPEGLWQHLESQFQPGMTRENRGEWHVDHIRPLASFDFEGDNLEAALHEAWNYTNLQPLWAEDNLRKGAKYEPEEFAEVNRDSETTLPDLLCEESEVSDVSLCLSMEEEPADFNWAEQS